VTRWKRIRYRLEWLALKLTLAVVPLLSRRACYKFAGAVGALAFTLDRHGRRVALANLEAAFGDKYTAAQRAEIARRSYQHFARTMLDLFWSPRLNEENFKEYVGYRDPEQVLADIEPTGGRCIVGSFHYSNFEWLSLAVGWYGFKGAITTQNVKNPLVNDFFRQLRERSGHTTISREGAVLKLFAHLRKGGSVAFLVDTTLPPHQPTVVIECFGKKTIVTVAPAWMQARTGLPIIPLCCEPVEEGRYRIVPLPKIQPPQGTTHQEIAQACWDSFEPLVRENPAPWMWMYKHWRYKPAGATGYPFYAQESPAFEQVASRPNYAPLDRAALAPAEAAQA
jgi:Kdo2-lipid IVA lauroyltransferase/acyltransferase